MLPQQDLSIPDYLFEFNSKLEANAFIRGVEFVNDSSLRLKLELLSLSPKRWQVIVTDKELEGVYETRY